MSSVCLILSMILVFLSFFTMVAESSSSAWRLEAGAPPGAPPGASPGATLAMMLRARVCVCALQVSRVCLCTRAGKGLVEELYVVELAHRAWEKHF